MTVSPGSMVMLPMVAVAHAGQAAHRLALRSGRHHDQLLLREALELVLANHGPVAVVEVAALEGDRRVLLHAPPERDHLAAVRPRGVDHLLHAADVAGEGRHDHPALRLANEPVQALADGRLGEGIALLLGPGRVGEEELDAAIADLGDEAQVGAPAIGRGVVELEVAGVDDRPHRRLDRVANPIGDRVADPERRDPEGPDDELMPRLHHVERGRFEQLVLAELALDESLGQRAWRRSACRGFGQDVGSPPVWSSWPWVRMIALTRSRFSSR